MKIVKVIGGLGNQMFQYAFFLSLMNKFPNERILIDTSLFGSYKLHNGFELSNVFHIESVDYATVKDIKKVTLNIRIYKIQRLFRRILPKLKTEFIEKNEFFYDDDVFKEGDFFYEGYWQNYNYFSNIKSLIQETYKFDSNLNLKNQNLLNEISNESQSVSIHVRRGDYLNHKTFGGICDLSYYLKSIEYAKKYFQNPTFYFFSNDFSWCNEILLPIIGDSKYHFIDWNLKQDSFVDMQLMSNCRLNIIANSSFSWWAAWLNQTKDKQVIAPAKWTHTIFSKDVLPQDWILL